MLFGTQDDSSRALSLRTKVDTIFPAQESDANCSSMLSRVTNIAVKLEVARTEAVRLEPVKIAVSPKTSPAPMFPNTSSLPLAVFRNASAFPTLMI